MSIKNSAVNQAVITGMFCGFDLHSASSSHPWTRCCWTVVPKFCYLGNMHGTGGVGEAARTRVRCVWAKFRELSPIRPVCGASYHIKGRIYRACVQSVLIDTWN